MKIFKKLVSALIVLTLVLSLTACKSKDDKEDTTPEPTKAPTTAPVEDAGEEKPDQQEPAQEPATDVNAGEFAEPTDVDLGAYLDGSTQWEDDGGEYSIKNNTLIFDNAYYGDFCAVMLPGDFQNVNVKFTAQLTDIATDLDKEAGTWWDSEFLLLVRANYPGPAFRESDPQAGYCITSWGDMKTFCLGRSGYDDAFGEFSWPLADGQPHKVEFTVTNNADNTKVYLKVVVDGVELASVVDDGSLVKKERPSLYPDAGGINFRVKYLGAKIYGYDEAYAPSATGSTSGAELEVVQVGDYFGDPAAWENNGDAYTLTADGLTLNPGGDKVAVRLNKEVQNAVFKFTLKLTDIKTDLSEEEGTWWDSEFLCLLRSALADKGWTDGQRGYSLTSWGDMNTFYLGRSGYDDAFGKYEWPLGDGQPHDFEITLQNSEDNSKVTITVKIDGKEVASVVDDGSLVKQDRPALYPEAGGLTFRAKNIGVVISK
jgi:hypothetical protein